jgi:hypothetical protein
MNGALKRGVIIALFAGAVVGVAIFSSASAAPQPVLFGGPSEERDSIVAWEARRVGAPASLMIAVSHTENWGGDPSVLNAVVGT